MYILAHIIGKSRRYTSFRHNWIQGRKLLLGPKTPCVGSASPALAQCRGQPVGSNFSSSKLSNCSKESFSSSTVQLNTTAVTNPQPIARNEMDCAG